MAAEEKKDEKDQEAKAEGAGEGDASSEEGLNPPKKKLNPKLLIAVGAVVLLLLGGGAGLLFSGALGGKSHEAAGEEGKAADAHGGAKGGKGEAAASKGGEEAKAGDEEGAAPKYYSLGDILVNLSGDGKRPNFLKIKVSLELANEKDVNALDALKPRIIDNFQVYLRELRIEDLKGSAGLYRLREELLLRVTEVVQPIRVRDVLFQEMLVQ